MNFISHQHSYSIAVKADELLKLYTEGQMQRLFCLHC